MIDFKRIGIKTIRTMAQTLVGVLPTTGLFWGWDWKPIVSATIIAGATCFLMGIADMDNNIITEEELQYDELVDDEEDGDE